jgi:hypothetical protein
MKIYKHLIFLSIATVFLFSCKQKSVKTIEKTYSETEYASADTAKGATRINISIEIPVCFHDQSVLEKIQKGIITDMLGDTYAVYSIDSAVPAFIDGIKTEYHKLADSFFKDADPGDAADNAFYMEQYYNIEGFPLLSNQQIFSYGISTQIYAGGAHDITTVNYSNYCLKTGEKLSEDDFFKPGYAAALTELIKGHMIQQSLEREDLPDILNWEDSDYYSDSIRPNGNFYISDEGFNYLFNPYEIAPYYIGSTEVKLPFDCLKDLLQDSSLSFLK